jgi:hypothetical protein
MARGSGNRTWPVALKATSIIALAAAAAILAISIASGKIAIAKPASEADYALDFGSDFKTSLASRDDLGISVVIAIDTSSSMIGPPKSGGEPKYRQASAALIAVVDLLDRLSREAPSDQVLKVGVLSFDENVREVMPLTRMDERGLADLRRTVGDPENFHPDNSTAIGEAVSRGVRDLSQSGTILRTLIIVTDGQNMQGTDPAWVLSAVYGDRNSAGKPGAPVVTSSILMTMIGFDIGLGYFASYEKYGARIASATDQAQLAAVLSATLEADITKLEAPSLEPAP